MDAANPNPVVFRNNWIIVALLYVAWLTFLLLALAFLIGFIANLFPFKGYDYNRLEILFALLSLALFATTLAARLWNIGRTMTHAQARLDSRGIDFVLGTKEAPQEQFFALDQIAAIRHKAGGYRRFYILVGKDGRSIQFGIFNFARPAHSLIKLPPMPANPFR